MTSAQWPGGQGLEAEVAENVGAGRREGHLAFGINAAFLRSKAKETGMSKTLNVHTSGGLAECCWVQKHGTK